MVAPIALLLNQRKSGVRNVLSAGHTKMQHYGEHDGLKDEESTNSSTQTWPHWIKCPEKRQNRVHPQDQRLWSFRTPTSVHVGRRAMRRNLDLPAGGAPAAWRWRSARMDRLALRAMAYARWAASRLACTLDLGALMDDGGAVTSQSFINRVAWHEFGA